MPKLEYNQGFSRDVASLSYAVTISYRVALKSALGWLFQFEDLDWRFSLFGLEGIEYEIDFNFPMQVAA